MNVYRDQKTKRLVKLFLVSPRFYTGSWFETEDMITGIVKKRQSVKGLTLVSVR